MVPNKQIVNPVLLDASFVYLTSFDGGLKNYEDYEKCLKRISEKCGGIDLTGLVDEKGDTLLHKVVADATAEYTIDGELVEKEDLEAIMAVLTLFSGNVNVQNKNGETPLHTAVLNNKFYVVYLLVQMGVDTQAPFNDVLVLNDLISKSKGKIKEFLKNADTYRQNYWNKVNENGKSSMPPSMDAFLKKWRETARKSNSVMTIGNSSPSTTVHEGSPGPTPHNSGSERADVNFDGNGMGDNGGSIGIVPSELFTDRPHTAHALLTLENSSAKSPEANIKTSPLAPGGSPADQQVSKFDKFMLKGTPNGSATTTQREQVQLPTPTTGGVKRNSVP